MLESDNNTLEALQTEVEFYRQNQSVVEREIRTLISDNQKLSQQVNMLYKEKLDSDRKSQNSDNGKEVEDLKKQVSFLAKERDSVHVLWQTSQKTIEALETELKTYHGIHGYGPSNEQINNALSLKDLELKLETSLNDYIDLESKYKELASKKHALDNDIRIKDKDIEKYKEKCTELDKKLFEVTKNVEELRVKLAAEIKCNENLSNQLSLYQKECVSYVKKEAEAKSKVVEALQLFDMMVLQRDQAYKRISEYSEELTELKRVLANLRGELEKNFRLEMDELRNSYNEKVNDMLNHIRNLDAELVEKGLLLNKTMRENKVLRATNESYLKKETQSAISVDPRIAAAEQRLEAMYNELVCSERRNIQLVCEKQRTLQELQRQRDWHGREGKRRDWEEQLLSANQEELKLQVEHLQKSLSDTHSMVNKLQNILISRNEINQRMVTTKDEELIELNKHLQNQMDLNKKWKETYIEMTEKLKNRFQDLQKENNELKFKLNLGDTESLDNVSSVSQ